MCQRKTQNVWRLFCVLEWYACSWGNEWHVYQREQLKLSIFFFHFMHNPVQTVFKSTYAAVNSNHWTEYQTQILQNFGPPVRIVGLKRCKCIVFVYVSLLMAISVWLRHSLGFIVFCLAGWPSLCSVQDFWPCFYVPVQFQLPHCVQHALEYTADAVGKPWMNANGILLGFKIIFTVPKNIFEMLWAPKPRRWMSPSIYIFHL